MVTISSSSFLLYQGCHEWCLSSLRDCLEIGRSGTAFRKISPEIEFTLPVKGGNSGPICWHMEIICGGEAVGDKPAFKVYIKVKVKDGPIGSCVGIKLAVSVLDESSTAIEEKVSHSIIKSDSSGCSSTWSFKLSSVPQSSLVKILGKVHVYDWTDETKNPPTSANLSLCPLRFSDCIHMTQYVEDFSNSLNKDRTEGVFTGAIIKHSEAEYKVHKCVLAIHSDFFKARFSDRWNMKDGKVHTVDMNDPDLTADIIEALLCSAYTGKVESLEVAVKLLPVTDKYQFKRLKGICESTIGSQLRKDNVLEIHGLAKDCNAQDLMARCESFVRL